LNDLLKFLLLLESFSLTSSFKLLNLFDALTNYFLIGFFFENYFGMIYLSSFYIISIVF